MFKAEEEIKKVTVDQLEDPEFFVLYHYAGSILKYEDYKKSVP